MRLHACCDDGLIIRSLSGIAKPYPITIDENVDKEDFAVFVRFLYLYEVSKELTPKLRRSLVLLARQYLVVGLEDYCRSFLKENISCKNVLLFLEEAIQQNLDDSVGIWERIQKS